MTQSIEKAIARLENLLPNGLKPHATRIFFTFSIIAVFVFLGFLFGFRFLVNWLVGTVFLVLFMTAWVVISEFLKKMNK
jgi:hypothetical protein